MPTIEVTTAVTTTRVLLVDDHELVRRGVRTLVDLEVDLEVVGEAEDVAGALKQLRRLVPGLVVVDIRLPDGDGDEVCREATALGVPVVVLTAFDDRAGLAAARAAGAAGVVLKSVDGQGLVAAMRRVAAGGTPGRAVERPGTGVPEPGVAAGVVAGRAALWRLTPRERAVLDLMAEGLSNRRIAAGLGISEKTVKNHVTGLLSKLGISRRTQAVALVLRQRD